MKTIKKQGDNLGGLLKLWAIPLADFTLNGSIITFSSQANIYELFSSQDSMDFSEASKVTAAGIHFEPLVTGFIPQDNASLSEALTYLTPRKWAVLFIDGNGNYKLAGNPWEPLRFSYELKTGTEVSDRAGCSFQFSGITKVQAAFVNNPF